MRKPNVPKNIAEAGRSRAFRFAAGAFVAWLMIAMTAALFAPVISPVLAAQDADGAPAGDGASRNRIVYVVPVHDTIDAGVNRFLKRAFREAEEAAARYVILDIRTLGGYLDQALEIGALIQDQRIPTIAYIRGNAFSAGSYIALSADQIVMQPGSAIGAAAIVDSAGRRVTDSKTVSAWVAKMRGAAERSGRNPLYAEGMVDDQIVVEVPELGVTYGRGQLISFTPEEAVKTGYAEHIASDIQGVLDYLGASGYTVVEMKWSLAEQIGRFLTNPIVQTILLIIGICGVFIELFVPGFGLPGIIGVAGFALYFTGNYIFGFAGAEHIVMFVAGILLLLIELFVPSFGILGILGIVSLIAGVVLSANRTGQAMLSLGIAFAVAIVVTAIVARIFRDRGIWNRFILKDRLDKESGYVSNTEHSELLGVTGQAVTVLRPSGIALLNGKRYDVVTNGEFIPAGTPVKVIHVEGLRVVVSEWKE